MATSFLDESLAILTCTPGALDALLRHLPEPWTSATDGPNTWSPYTVIRHLIHAETHDWMPRLEIILEHGESRPFAAFDRDAQSRETDRPPLPLLLDEFAELRQNNLARLRALHLQPAQLKTKGLHPALGPVTLRQLLATWTAHDLGHILQITRTMARRYKEEVGPWSAYLSAMKP